MWVILADVLWQNHLCLSSAAVDDSLTTCLVGIPFKPPEFPKNLINFQTQVSKEKASHHTIIQSRTVYKTPFPITNPLALWQEWVEMLLQAEREPQAFELIGSSCAPFCVHSDFRPHQYYHNVKESEHVKQTQKEFAAANWCQPRVNVTMPSTGDESPSPLKLEITQLKREISKTFILFCAFCHKTYFLKPRAQQNLCLSRSACISAAIFWHKRQFYSFPIAFKILNRFFSFEQHQYTFSSSSPYIIYL